MSAYVNKNRAHINAQRRARYAKNSAPTLAQNKAYRQRASAKLKRNRMLRVYGTDGEAMFRAQRGQCAICETGLLRRSRHPRAAHLDHCHRTGKVRAWLCSRCNVGIGGFHDDAALLARAAAYLRKHARSAA